ncbi:DNA mismatch repair endonuclease MutL [Aliidiomarina celeris]|uniref:DNA mismatch repair endonuclease MutL n=1 Tax=Aliidiomarina celeris TaxID=2249428 RepID=UPI000DEAB848|nr:DNA mismatch repair endonuclease MutL [Aliidiomarina celeris]
MPIQLLPTQLANQIAAGEVVERPASVVKELVENSIDAGASEIQIDIEKGGSRRIRVRDNGAGIPEGELTLALSRHATSKISTLDDLEAILSLGFRGEALASVSSVSRLTLTAKTAEQDSAFSAFCEGRDMAVRVEPASHPVGTTVDVEDLFFNTPARRKFLRTEKTEFSHIEEVVRRIALAQPQVSFKLVHNGQLVRNFPAFAAPEQRIAKVVGKRFADEAVVFDTEQGDYRLSGWVSPPEVCRHQNDVQYFYVNGRMMRDRLLNHAVRQAYGESLADDRQPSFVIYFQLPARDVDVNVHPAKHEVRFHQSRHVHDFVLATLRRALADYIAPTVEKTHHYQAPDPSRYQAVAQGRAGEQPFVQSSPLQEVNVSATQPTISAPSSAAAYQGSRPQSAFQVSSAPQTNQARARGPSTNLTAGAVQAWGQMLATPLPTTTDWQIVTMLDDRWALVMQRAESSAALGLVCSHALQKKAVALQISTGIEQGLSGQPLLLPTQIEYPDIHTILASYSNVLARLGVQLRAVKVNQCAVLQVPAVMRRTVISQSVPALLDRLQAQPADLPMMERTDVVELLVQFATDSGAQSTPLTLAQVSKLWAELAPAHRPTIVPLDWQQSV